jgi:hypothetical protein
MPIDAAGKTKIYKLHDFLCQNTATLRRLLVRVFPAQIISLIPIMIQ